MWMFFLRIFLFYYALMGFMSEGCGSCCECCKKNEYASLFDSKNYLPFEDLVHECKEDDIDIFIKADDFYLPSFVTIKSILNNSQNKENLHFIILFPSKMKDEEKRKWKKYLSVFSERTQCRIDFLVCNGRAPFFSISFSFDFSFDFLLIPWMKKRGKVFFLSGNLLFLKDIELFLKDIDISSVYCAWCFYDGVVSQYINTLDILRMCYYLDILRMCYYLIVKKSNKIYLLNFQNISMMRKKK